MDVNFQFDWSAAFSSIPYLLPGIPWTLLISFGGLAIGFFIGIFFGLLRISPVRVDYARCSLQHTAQCAVVVALRLAFAPGAACTWSLPAAFAGAGRGTPLDAL